MLENCSFSIVGYWTSKQTGLVFPVIESPQIDLNTFNSLPVGMNSVKGTNNSTLANIRGTIWGDMLAFGLQFPTPTGSSYEYHMYKEISDATHHAYLGVGLMPKASNGLFYATLTNAPEWNANSNMASFEPFIDRFITPQYYRPFGVLRIYGTDNLATILLNYIIGDEHSVICGRTSNSNSLLWVTGLSALPKTPTEDDGKFTDDVPDPNVPEPDDPDGNVPTDTQNPGGYDPDSDDIPFGVQNWLNASALGLCTVYNPTVAQVQALATRLYSKDFWSGFENYLWGNPVESILGLSVVPCAVPDGGQGTVKSWGLDTGVTMTLAGSTLVHVDCGQLPVPKLYETYLDWSPYTIAEIYIPYVGFVGLDVDDIMGQNLQLHYYIDIISCSAICQLVISNTSTTTVLGQWSCQVGRQIPVGSKDYNDIINAGIQLVATTIGAVGGNVIPEVVTDLGDALQYEGGGFNGARFATQMLRAGSSAIMQAKPNITRGAAIANASGQLAVQYPYLILKRPVAAQSNGYGALVGFPTFKYGNIGSYTGYVRCHNIKLDGIAATDWELSEIFRLCCEGVYI